MASLGEMLRDARESRGISLADAERETKIRQKYILAIEDDKLATLPGPVFARGFLRNYAAYLGLDADEVLEMFDEQSQPTRNKIRAARGEPVNKGKGRKGDKINIQPLSPEPIDSRVRYGSSYIAISLLALPLIVLFYFVYSAYAGRTTNVPIPTAQARPATVTPLKGLPSVIAGGAGSAVVITPTVNLPASPGTLPGTAVNAAATQPIQAGNSIEVQVTTTRDSWMSVIVDGVQQYSGTLAKGKSRQWKGNETVRIRTGRADSVQVVINGTDRGLMGDRDHLIVEKEWSRSGKERVIQK